MWDATSFFYEVVGPLIDLAVNKLVLSVGATSRARSHWIPLSAPPPATGKACGHVRRAKLVAVHCRLKLVLISPYVREAWIHPTAYRGGGILVLCVDACSRLLLILCNRGRDGLMCCCAFYFKISVIFFIVPMPDLPDTTAMLLFFVILVILSETEPPMLSAMSPAFFSASPAAFLPTFLAW